MELLLHPLDLQVHHLYFLALHFPLLFPQSQQLIQGVLGLVLEVEDSFQVPLWNQLHSLEEVVVSLQKLTFLVLEAIHFALNVLLLLLQNPLLFLQNSQLFVGFFCLGSFQLKGQSLFLSRDRMRVLLLFQGSFFLLQLALQHLYFAVESDSLLIEVSFALLQLLLFFFEFLQTLYFFVFQQLYFFSIQLEKELLQLVLLQHPPHLSLFFPVKRLQLLIQEVALEGGQFLCFQNPQLLLLNLLVAFLLQTFLD